MATDYTDGLALKAMKNVFDYLPTAYNEPANVEGTSEDGGCFLHGWYGVCQCIPGRMPLHGS